MFKSKICHVLVSNAEMKLKVRWLGQALSSSKLRQLFTERVDELLTRNAFSQRRFGFCEGKQDDKEQQLTPVKSYFNRRIKFSSFTATRALHCLGQK